MTSFDAIILAGGRGSRLGGVSKADLTVGGVRLLDRVLDAAAGAATTVVVGPVRAPEGAIVTREDPPGTGPAAGLAAGLDAVSSPADWTLVLACDLPDASGAVAALLDAARAGGADAYCLAGRDGQPEWLLGLYRSTALRDAARAYGDPRNRSVRGMIAPLSPVLITADAPADDLDTWADHARWNADLRRRNSMNKNEDRSEWRPFIDAACAATDVSPDAVDEDAILAMTREIAHAGARPMAPVSAFMLGMAVGRGGDADYLRRVIEDAATAAPLPENEV